MALTHPVFPNSKDSVYVTDRTDRRVALHGKLRTGAWLGELPGESRLYGGVGGQDIFPKPPPFLLWPLQNGQCWFLTNQDSDVTCPGSAIHYPQDIDQGSLSKSLSPKRWVETVAAGFTWMAHCLPPQLHLAPRSSQGVWADHAVSVPGEPL